MDAPVYVAQKSYMPSNTGQSVNSPRLTASTRSNRCADRVKPLFTKFKTVDLVFVIIGRDALEELDVVVGVELGHLSVARHMRRLHTRREL